ncbi:MAG: NAD(P)H-hydrate dehydratase [Desulfosarcinaceae bacterium]|nr:NAD(P)H-hydrate dehydratase [Desulfosarcinaceae bacterium]
MDLVTAAEMQQMDRETIKRFGLPGRVLMENAGRGATAFFLETTYRKANGGAVGVVAGRGNNGGDGFVMARYLYQRGIPVTVYLLSETERVTGDARVNLELISRLGVAVIALPDQAAFTQQAAQMSAPAVWIDALLGTGLNADVRGYYRSVITFLNATKKPIFAVDIPSGLNADTGRVQGICITADATATFAFAKVGHLLYPGAEHTGRLKVIEIGIPPHIARGVGCRQHLMTADAAHALLRPRDPLAHKGTTGHLLVIAGKSGTTGAAAMAAMAALRAGAGLVTLGCPQGVQPLVAQQTLEAMTVGLAETPLGGLSTEALPQILGLSAGRRCVALGPGIGTEAETGDLLEALVSRSPLPLVIDADGLNLLAERLAVLTAAEVPIILTPHPGEMSRLTGHPTAELLADRVASARKFATEHGVTLVLKGARTVVASQGGEVWINLSGNSGMASGGMGDVLTGIIAALVTQGSSPEAAARLGVYLHGAAGDRLAATMGPQGYLASDLMAILPETISQLASAHHPEQPLTDILLP